MKNLIDQIRKIAIDVENGEENPLTAFALLKGIEKDLKGSLSIVEEIALDEAAKYDKTFTFEGYQFTQRNGATRYDFKHLEAWNNKKNELKSIEDASKEAYKMSLKGMEAFNTETGEQVPLPKVSGSKDSLTVKIG